jgi:hypothetical protein
MNNAARIVAGLTLLTLLLAPPHLSAQTSPRTTASQNTMLLTVFLKHDQSKTLDQLEEQLKKTGFYRDFPPAGTEIVSWYVMMGVGQVVTLRLPPEKLREVNRYFEQRAWGAFRTEFYPTYDFKQAFQQLKEGK